MKILILTQNNEKTIQKCLSTLEPLGGQIVIGDLNSTDRTKIICRKHQIISLNFKGNYSDVKNELISHVKNDMVFSIEPYEFLAQGIEIIKEKNEKNIYSPLVIQSGIASREIRLWHSSLNIKFENPVFETIMSDNQECINSVIICKGNRNYSEKSIIEWKKSNPIDISPYYYQCCLLLQNKKYDEFITIGTHFINNSKSRMPIIMTKYYMASVYLYIKKDFNKCLDHISYCISEKPDMAEFWCLIGDMFHSLRYYKRAISFYENAIIAGEKRLNDDLFPMEIDKYLKIPTEKIDICNKHLSTI